MIVLQESISIFVGVPDKILLRGAPARGSPPPAPLSSRDDRSSGPRLDPWVAEAVRAFQRGRGEERDEPFGRLHARFAPVTLNLFRRLRYDRETAEDLNQETWGRIFERLDEVDEPDRFVGWMFIVARSIEQHHRRGSRAVKRSGVEVEAEPDDGLSPVPPVEPDQEEKIEQQQTYQELRAAIDELSPQQRRCVRLHYLEELKIDEIARVLKLAPGTVKAHLHYARNRLREILRGSR